LHENVVPNLDVLAAMASRSAVRSARGLSGIDEHLGIGTTRTRFAGRTPPVILAGEEMNTLFRYAKTVPDRGRLIIAGEDGVPRDDESESLSTGILRYFGFVRNSKLKFMASFLK